ncbi:MAG: hypothetical protein R3E89_06080 [Thiolinea sp.]
MKSETSLFIKLDSWHITQFPLIRQAFPDTPCLFVYRRPHEILRSHQKQRGMQMVPGLIPADALGLDSQPVNPADLDAYCLRVLSGFFRYGKQYADTCNLRLVNYTQLPDFVWTDFAQSFALNLDEETVAKMQGRSTQHSKNPVGLFVEDRYSCTDYASHPLMIRLEKDYEALERIRCRA